MIRFTATALASALLLGTAAQAQEDRGAGTAADPKINTVIIFGDDECPQSTDEQINVCAILVEADRYRIPAPLRSDPNDPKNEAWTNRVIAYQYVGRDGTQSCSASGAGGFTGCGLKEIDSAYAERKKDPGLAFGRMIAEERRKRLAGIDAEAAAVEARVVQFEKERAEREARQAGQAEPLPEDEATPPEPK
jgi:hypothetical protein